MMSNIRFVLRNLGRNRAFAATAILSLALGIGANTAIFSLTNQILLSALPVEEPSRLVLFKWRGTFIGGSSRGWQDKFSYPAYNELCTGNPGVFRGIAAEYQTSVNVLDRGVAERATAEVVSGNYFDVIGVTAALGRTLTPDDDRLKDSEPFVVLSHDYWQRRFGASRDVLNRLIDVNGHPMTVIGVARNGFERLNKLGPSDLFVPLQMKLVVTPTWDDRSRRDSIWLTIVARLAPGVDSRTAQGAIDIPYHRVLENDLEAHARNRDVAERYRKNHLLLTEASKGVGTLQKFFEKPLYVLMVMVGTLLMITHINLAGLLITRASARQKEIAIRLSLGATRGSLVRLIMAESMILAGVGGGLGVILSSWITSLLLHLLPFQNIEVAIRTDPDPAVLGFAFAISLMTAVVFGLLPALQASRPDLAPTLKEAAASVSLGAGQTRLRRLLVTAQISLSLLLLVGGGLFARSLHTLLTVKSGIQTTGLLLFSIDPSMHKYTPERSRRLFIDALHELSQLPGVTSASASSFPVLANDEWQNGYVVEGYHPGPKQNVNAGWNEVLPGFFSALGVPLIAGRDFTERDNREAPSVAIVNESFAKHFFPFQNPLGRHIGFKNPDIEIVGVVKDSKAEDLKENNRECTYTPLLQESKPSEATFYVRSTTALAGLAPTVRQTLKRLDGTLPVLDMKTMDEQINETHFLDRLFALLAGVFGLLATLLASIGLYGVTASSVTGRTQEIGIRIALGATHTSVVRMILREVLVLTAVGVALGFRSRSQSVDCWKVSCMP